MLILFANSYRTYLPMENKNLEESVHQQYPIRLNRACVQQYGFGRPIEAVTIQNRLYHNQWLCEILPHQHVPVVRRFVRRVIEDLQKLRPTQMIHELRVQAEVLRKPEAVWIVLVVFPKLLTLKPNNLNGIRIVSLRWLPVLWAFYRPIAEHRDHRLFPPDTQPCVPLELPQPLDQIRRLCGGDLPSRRPSFSRSSLLVYVFVQKCAKHTA